MNDEYEGYDDDDDFSRHGGDGSLTRVTYGDGPLESLAERYYGNPDRVIQTVEELAADGSGYDTEVMGQVIDAFVKPDSNLDRAEELWDAFNNGASEYDGPDPNPYEISRKELGDHFGW